VYIIVRDKVKTVIELLKDPEKLKEERENSKNLRNKMGKYMKGSNPYGSINSGGGSFGNI